MLEFQVKRIETATRMCKACGGTGKRKMSMNGSVFCSDCHAGCTEGRYTVVHETWVSLASALQEMGLIEKK